MVLEFDRLEQGFAYGIEWLPSRNDGTPGGQADQPGLSPG
jgi:hypothetical protein